MEIISAKTLREQETVKVTRQMLIDTFIEYINNQLTEEAKKGSMCYYYSNLYVSYNTQTGEIIKGAIRNDYKEHWVCKALNDFPEIYNMFIENGYKQGIGNFGCRTLEW